MKKYLYLFKTFFLANIKSVMIYDLDYIFGIIAMILKSGVDFSLLLVVYSLVDNLSGWDINHLLLLYGITLTCYSFWHCFFIDTITIPTYIESGEMDRFLLKPINPLFQIMLESFDEDGWGELIFGLIITIIAIVKLELYSLRLLMLPLIFTSGCLIFAGISILCSSVVFYTVGNIDLTDAGMELKEYAKYPIYIYNKVLRIFFTVIIPLGCVSFYPSLFILEFNTQNLVKLIVSILISIIFFIVSCIIWNKALKHYSSSGT